MTDQDERLAGYAMRLREAFPTLAVEEIQPLGGRVTTMTPCW